MGDQKKISSEQCTCFWYKVRKHRADMCNWKPLQTIPQKTTKKAIEKGALLTNIDAPGEILPCKVEPIVPALPTMSTTGACIPALLHDAHTPPSLPFQDDYVPVPFTIEPSPLVSISIDDEASTATRQVVSQVDSEVIVVVQDSVSHSVESARTSVGPSAGLSPVDDTKTPAEIEAEKQEKEAFLQELMEGLEREEEHLGLPEDELDDVSEMGDTYDGTTVVSDNVVQMQKRIDELTQQVAQLKAAGCSTGTNIQPTDMLSLDISDIISVATDNLTPKSK